MARRLSTVAALARRLPPSPPRSPVVASIVPDETEEEDNPYAWNVDDDFDLLERQGCEMSKLACAAIIRDAGARRCLRDIRRVQQHLQSTNRREASLSKLMIEWFGKCGSFDEAKGVFDALRYRNPEMWGCIVGACIDCGRDVEAFGLFRTMLQRGTLIRREVYAHVLASCSNRRCLDQGKLVHACILEAGLETRASIMNRVIDMYAACGSLVLARRVFDSLPWRNAGTWASIVAAYAQNGHPGEALRLFWKMDSAGDSKLHPEEETCLMVLGCCSSIDEVRQVQVRVAAIGYDAREAVFENLCRLQGLQEAAEAFQELGNDRKIVQWEAMVRAYDDRGDERSVLQLHRQMQLEGVKTSENAYLTSVLARCRLLELRP